jgi:transposase
MALRVRSLTTDEQAALERLARARPASAGHVKRARVILLAQEGLRIPEIAARLDICIKTARLWLHRFTTLGIRGLDESPRAGRPRIYPPEQVAVVIETALTKPETLGLPFACWTLDRLAAYIVVGRLRPTIKLLLSLYL